MSTRCRSGRREPFIWRRKRFFRISFECIRFVKEKDKHLDLTNPSAYLFYLCMMLPLMPPIPNRKADRAEQPVDRHGNPDAEDAKSELYAE